MTLASEVARSLAPLPENLRHEKIARCTNARLSDANLGDRHLRCKRPPQRDDGRLGWNLLFRPALVAISLRKATYTYGSLMARRAFTVNVPAENQVRAADYFGVVSGRDRDKFAARASRRFAANWWTRYVEEFPLLLDAASSMFSSWACTRSSSVAFSM